MLYNVVLVIRSFLLAYVGEGTVYWILYRYGWLFVASVGCGGVVNIWIGEVLLIPIGHLSEDACLAHNVFRKLPQWRYKDMLWYGCGEVCVTTHSHTFWKRSLFWQVLRVHPVKDTTPGPLLVVLEAPYELGAKPVPLSSIAISLSLYLQRQGIIRKLQRSYSMRSISIGRHWWKNAPKCLMS